MLVVRQVNNYFRGRRKGKLNGEQETERELGEKFRFEQKL